MRNLPTLFRDAISAGSYIHGHAVEMDFATGNIERINTTPYILNIGGNNFNTAHGGLSLTAIKESNNMSDQGISVTLSGIDPVYVDALININPQGRSLRAWEIVLNPDHTLKSAYAVGMWRMDTLTMALGAKASVTLKAGSAWSAWDKNNTRTYTDGDQKSRYSQDDFFNQLIPSIDRTILWGRV